MQQSVIGTIVIIAVIALLVTAAVLLIRSTKKDKVRDITANKDDTDNTDE